MTGSLCRAVYPRVCGGTPEAGFLAAVLGALSPRVRGNLVRRERLGEDQGSIPACAGEPIKKVETGRRGTLYPRVCGGTVEDSSSPG